MMYFSAMAQANSEKERKKERKKKMLQQLWLHIYYRSFKKGKLHTTKITCTIMKLLSDFKKKINVA